MFFDKKYLFFSITIALLSFSMKAMQPSQEAIQRFKNLLGDNVYDPDMKSVPNDINGIGYIYYPIIIKSSLNIKEILTLNLRPSKGLRYDLTKMKSYDEQTIVKDLVYDFAQRAHPAFYNRLSIYENFLDPLLVTEAINKLKSQQTFIKFMHAMDLLELNIDNTTIYFNDGEFKEEKSVETDKYKISFNLLPINNPEGHIFNWLIEINIDNIITKDNNTDMILFALNRLYEEINDNSTEKQIEDRCNIVQILINASTFKDYNFIEYVNSDKDNLLILAANIHLKIVEHKLPESVITKSISIINKIIQSVFACEDCKKTFNWLIFSKNNKSENFISLLKKFSFLENIKDNQDAKFLQNILLITKNYQEKPVDIE